MRADTITMPLIGEQVTVTTYEAAPVIFFEKNSTQPIRGTSTVGAFQQNILDAVRAYVEARPGVHLTIVGTSAADEEPQLARERISFVARTLQIDPNRVTVRMEQAPEARYPDLADEQRTVAFLIDGKAVVIPVIRRDTVRTLPDAIITLTHVLTCEAGPCTTSVTASYGETILRVNGDGPVHTLTIPGTDLARYGMSVPFVARAFVTDTTGRTVTSQRSYVVRPTLKQRDERQAMVSPENISGDALVLGHFGFDTSEFTTTNDAAVRRVREAIAAGRTVTLVPGADSLGTAEYNDALMLRRAKAAIALLGVRESDVRIEVVRSTTESNATPMGRIANRSVRAIIK